MTELYCVSLQAQTYYARYTQSDVSDLMSPPYGYRLSYTSLLDRLLASFVSIDNAYVTITHSHIHNFLTKHCGRIENTQWHWIYTGQRIFSLRFREALVPGGQWTRTVLRVFGVTTNYTFTLTYIYIDIISLSITYDYTKYDFIKMESEYNFVVRNCSKIRVRYRYRLGTINTGLCV